MVGLPVADDVTIEQDGITTIDVPVERTATTVVKGPPTFFPGAFGALHDWIDRTWIGTLPAMALIGILVEHLNDVAARQAADRRLQERRSRDLEETCDARRGGIGASDSSTQRVAAPAECSNRIRTEPTSPRELFRHDA